MNTLQADLLAHFELEFLLIPRPYATLKLRETEPTKTTRTRTSQLRPPNQAEQVAGGNAALWAWGKV